MPSSAPLEIALVSMNSTDIKVCIAKTAGCTATRSALMFVIATQISFTVVIAGRRTFVGP
jgi:hypothetical protein